MLELRFQEIHMAADSNSQIAWHRAQIRKHRDALKQYETSRFTFGAIASPKAADQTQEIVTELKRKIRDSEQIVAAHERQSRRPLSTDFQTLASAPWSKWNDRGPSSTR
jgi:biotin synthase-related radical SAM superfamily protein